MLEPSLWVFFHKAKITFAVYALKLFKQDGNTGMGGTLLNFKSEICLLMAAIGLFAVSAFLYSYESFSEGFTFAASFEYPYQGYAISFVGFGSLLMVAASISYLRRSKTTQGKLAACRV
jgi:hypothetical protein